MSGQIVGHFNDLGEVEKLTQSRLLQGVIQETIEEGGLLSMLPWTQISGKSLKYNREGSLPSAAAYDIHEQIPWSADVTFVEVESTLKRFARQDILDKFIQKTYANINDYKSIMVSTLRKGVNRTIEDKLIYGNNTTNSKEFDGLHALCPAAQTIHQSNNGDGTGDPLSLNTLRQLLDLVRVPNQPINTGGARPITFLLTTFEIARRIDAATQPGIATYNSGITFTADQFGRRQTLFDSVPIIRSDFLKQTELLTSGNAFLSKTGGATGSIFAIRLGMIEDGGLCGLVGSGMSGGPELFQMTEFDTLEDYDAGGVRLVAYPGLALGSTKSIARLDGITDAAVVV